MKFLTTILALLGAAGSLFVGFKWTYDLMGLSELERLMAEQMHSGIARGATFLILGGFASIFAIILHHKEKPLIAGITFLASGLIPIFFHPSTAIFNFGLLIAGGLCLQRHFLGSPAPANL